MILFSSLFFLTWSRQLPLMIVDTTNLFMVLAAYFLSGRRVFILFGRLLCQVHRPLMPARRAEQAPAPRRAAALRAADAWLSLSHDLAGKSPPQQLQTLFHVYAVEQEGRQQYQGDAGAEKTAVMDDPRLPQRDEKSDV